MELAQAQLLQSDVHTHAGNPLPHGMHHQSCKGCQSEGTQKTLDIMRTVLQRDASVPDDVKIQVWEVITKPFTTPRKIWNS